ncbi:MAG: type 1 periplasmic binding fold superfamily protein [Flavobacteriales bacterium]|nr:type 1 periplasmic binding fold superfamily protein [Flavobacteriales bacterium]
MLRPASLLLALLILGFTSCELHHDEAYEEPITSFTYILTPDTGSTVVLQYLDRDGDGGQEPIVHSGTLLANTVYEGQLLINSMGKHIIDTTSIMQAPEMHQIFYLPMNGLQLQTTYTDQDANGNPVGFSTQLTTGDASRGRLTILIKHEPDKHALGVADGDVSNAVGSIDFEVDFNVVVSD